MTNPTAGFLAWIERLTGLHIHWHRAWDTHPNRALVFRCRCGHEQRSSI